MKHKLFSKQWIEDKLACRSTSGFVMLFAMFASIICSNTSARAPIHDFLDMQIILGIGELSFSKSIEWWVNDVLMVFFFLGVGLELKKEMREGFLSQSRYILLPCLAAIGGIICPALIYTLFNYSTPEYRSGWAIPTATDIAFALCILMLIGRNVHQTVRVFLLAIAIFDDLGAILIISISHHHAYDLTLIFHVIFALSALFVLNRMQVSVFLPYFLFGVVLWSCFLSSGAHATITGVVMAMAYPMRVDSTRQSPLNNLIKLLKPWLDFFILPIFAFSSASLYLQDVSLNHLTAPVPLGIIFGLFFGKQIGVFFTILALIKFKIAAFPKTVTLIDLYGMSVLTGIGFTMALFKGKLALPDGDIQQDIRLGILCGSSISALWAFVVFRYADQALNWLKKKRQKEESEKAFFRKTG